MRRLDVIEGDGYQCPVPGRVKKEKENISTLRKGPRRFLMHDYIVDHSELF
jgi:hypothetical protein